MKKTFISFLIMILVTSTSTPLFSQLKAYAATTDSYTTESSADGTIKVSLDNIKEIMTENNLAIKILFNKMKVANETYHDALDTYQEYEDKYDDDDDAPTVGDKPNPDEYEGGTDNEEYQEKLADYNDEVAALEEYNKYKSAKSSYETALDDYKTERDAYETGIEDQVNSARQAYVEYLTDVSSRELQENKVKVQQRDAQADKLQYDYGFLSKIEYDKSVQGMTTETDSLSKLKDAEELAKSKLCTTLGISDDEHVTFTTDIKDYLDKVSQINYDDDSAKMLDNNYNIKTANDDIDDLEDDKDDYDDSDKEDIYDYKMDSAESTLKQTISTAKLDFKEQYNTLMSSYNTLKNDYDNLNQEKTDYNITQIKYDYGFISKNDLEDAKVGSDGLDSVNSDYENAKLEFYKNYLRYLQMKEGY